MSTWGSWRRLRLLIGLAAGLLAGASTGGCRKAARSDPSPARPPAPAGVFRERAHEAGLRFHWGHGGRSPLDIIETLGHGCAFLDVDQDGFLDILLVGDEACALYHGNRDGTFTDVTREVGLTARGQFFGVAVGDYDNDGYPDAYVTGYGKCVLYHNTGGPGGARRFEDVTAQAGVGARGPYDVVTAAAFADLDGDGRLDLFAGRYIVFTPTTIRWCTYSGVKAGCGVKNYGPDAPRVYRNLGSGAFKDVTRAWGFDALHGRCLGVAVSAAENPRGVALYAANDELPGDLMVPDGSRYRNIGVPSSTAYSHEGLTQGGMGVDWGDFDNNGRTDLVVATFQNEPKSVYRSDGKGMYTELSGPLGIAADTAANVAWTAKFFDYDNDGWLDLLFTNGHSQDNVEQVERDRTYAQRMQLFHNEKGDLFRLASAGGGPMFQRPIVGRGAAFGDYDNDGRTDVLVVDEEGVPLLLHNEAQTGHHWLGIGLVGGPSNRDAIGARVTLTAGARTLTRDLSLCGGYISGHDPRLLFGLGDAARVDEVVVRWPGGAVERIRDVPVDRYVRIVEGQGVAR